MALPNAKNQYLKTQIETASKEQLVVMLFDGIIRFTENARKAMQEEKIEESHNALMRAQAIVMELICTLDREKGGEVANNLMSLHAYAFNCLIVCNMKKDISKIDEVQHIYRELREGWVGAMERLGIGASSAAGASADRVSVASGAPATAGAASPAAPIAKTPLTAMAPKAAPLAAPAAPASLPGKPLGNSGIMASSAAPAPASVLKTAPAAAVAPAAAAPAATGYGMGRTAMLAGIKPAMPAPAAAVAAPIAAKPVVAPTPAPKTTPAAPASANAKQAAMLSAYGKTRSIA